MMKHNVHSSGLNSSKAFEENKVQSEIKKKKDETSEEVKKLGAIKQDALSVRQNKNMVEQLKSVEQADKIKQTGRVIGNNKKKITADMNFMTSCHEVKTVEPDLVKTNSVEPDFNKQKSFTDSHDETNDVYYKIAGIHSEHSDNFYKEKRNDDENRKLFRERLLKSVSPVQMTSDHADFYENVYQDDDTSEKKRLKVFSITGILAGTYEAQKFAFKMKRKYSKGKKSNSYNSNSLRKVKRSIIGHQAAKTLKCAGKVSVAVGNAADKTLFNAARISRGFQEILDASESDNNAEMLLMMGLNKADKVNDIARRAVLKKRTDAKVKKISKKTIEKINNGKSSGRDSVLQQKVQLSRMSHKKMRTGADITDEDRQKIESLLGIHKKNSEAKEKITASNIRWNKDYTTLQKSEKKIKKLTGKNLEKKNRNMAAKRQMRAQARNYIIRQIATEEGADPGAFMMDLMKTRGTSIIGNMTAKAGKGIASMTKNIFKYAARAIRRLALPLIAACLPLLIVIIIVVVILGGVCGGESADAETDSSGNPTDVDITDLDGGTDQKIWVYLKKQNLSDITVAAIMGNLQQESRLNPRSGENGSHMGIVSWDKDGRFAALQAYAKQQNKDCWDLNVQLDYMMKELNGSGWIDKKAKLPVLKSCERLEHLDYKSESDYGAVWCIARYYEICTSDTELYGVQNYTERFNFAENFYNKFAGKDLDTLQNASNDLNQSNWNQRDKNNIKKVTLTQVTKYACKFIGNKYVWGGSSLTEGCDCSGFTMSVYKKFGVNLPHSSAGQANCGTKIDGINQAQPGDLIFYAKNGKIHHVALYLGNNLIVNASNSSPYPSGGIKTQAANYAPIYWICRPNIKK